MQGAPAATLARKLAVLHSIMTPVAPLCATRARLRAFTAHTVVSRPRCMRPTLYTLVGGRGEAPRRETSELGEEVDELRDALLKAKGREEALHDVIHRCRWG